MRPSTWLFVVFMVTLLHQFGFQPAMGEDLSQHPKRCLHITTDAHHCVDSTGAICDPVDVVGEISPRSLLLGDDRWLSKDDSPKARAALGLYPKGCCLLGSSGTTAAQGSGDLCTPKEVGVDHPSKCYKEFHLCISCCGLNAGQRNSASTGQQFASFHECVTTCRHSARDTIGQNNFGTLTHHCFV
eukprot:GILI01025087.1.p1 GENE.GILI01025087.1~~GILI01025087.1.p1  ORF type:complete len:186 (+),score=7.12 GILI01025087.1:70-627(+)